MSQIINFRGFALALQYWISVNSISASETKNEAQMTVSHHKNMASTRTRSSMSPNSTEKGAVFQKSLNKIRFPNDVLENQRQ